MSATSTLSLIASLRRLMKKSPVSDLSLENAEEKKKSMEINEFRRQSLELKEF